jgi:hypothetical protein
VPNKTFPAVPSVSAPGDRADVVPWDEWHRRFSNLARGPLLANVKRLKNPSGADTVEITVTNDNRLSIKLTKKSNQDFDHAILQAYQALSGNAGLKFPTHSRRKSITFLIDNEHQGPGMPSTILSTPSTGDKEIIHRHI